MSSPSLLSLQVPEKAAARLYVSQLLSAALEAWPVQANNSLEEKWTFFEVLVSQLTAESPQFWAARLHPDWRSRLTHLWIEGALVRLELEAYLANPEREIWLWEAAFACDGQALREFEAKSWLDGVAPEWGYQSAKHRLADLYRRMGSTERRAINLYIEIWSGREVHPVLRSGIGAHFTPWELLHKALAVGAEDQWDLAEIMFRLGGCLRLQTRGFDAPWITSSILHARAKRAVYAGQSDVSRHVE